MKTIRAKVSGTVQGVFYRKFVKEEADKLGLKGHVRNMEDGNVEIIAEGPQDSVDNLIRLCKQGPRHSQVKNIEVIDLNHQGFDDFKILHV